MPTERKDAGRRPSHRWLRPALERAADPSTEPDELALLAEHESVEVCRAVARNPNAPAPVLDLLGSTFPGEVAENPALSLLSLADPTLAWMHRETALALCSCPGSPAWLLAELGRRGPEGFGRRAVRPVGCGLAAGMEWTETLDQWWGQLAVHPRCPPEVLARLMACEVPELRAAASSHPSAPRPLLDLLLRAGSTERLRSAAHPGEISDDERTELVSSGHWGRVLVVSHPSTRRSLREQLLDEACRLDGQRGLTTHAVLAEKDALRELFLALFSNPGAEPDELDAMFARATRAAGLSPLGHDAAPLLLALAKNPASPPSLLQTLSCSLVAEVRAAVAAHPSLDPAWLADLLAAGAAPDLSGMVADPPPVDPEHLVALATLKGFPSVLVASHPHLPARIVERLLHDRSEPVRRALLHNPAFGVVRASQIAARGPLSLRRLLAEASWLPRHIFACLAKTDDAEVRYRLRTNPARPRDLVIKE